MRDPGAGCLARAACRRGGCCACGHGSDDSRVIGAPRSSRVRTPSATPIGWRSISRRGRREPAWPADISVRTVMADDERLVYDPRQGGLARRVRTRSTRSFEDWRHWTTVRHLRPVAVVSRASTEEDRRRLLALPPGPRTTRTPVTSPRSEFDGRGGGEASARPCCCTRFGSFATVATPARRSVSTRRARPARRGCTSAPACASTATPSSSSARFVVRFSGVSRLRARCPDCRTLTAVALGPGVPVPLLRPRVLRRARPRSARVGSGRRDDGGGGASWSCRIRRPP